MGRSRKHVVALIDAWLLPAEGVVHKRIPIAALEEFLGRGITIDDWAATERALIRPRALQRTRNLNRHASVAGTDLPALSRQESPSSVRPAAA
jgi:hypothetical protein